MMAILLKNNMMFFHIPKTGGNWVTKVLKENDLIKKILPEKHDIPAIIRKKYPNIHPIKTFCFIRNPMSWYESWFQYATMKRWRDWGRHKWHPCKKLNGLGDKAFNKFIENVIEKCPSYLSNLYELYINDCDFVGKQENLEDDLKAILGKDIKLIDKVGVSPKLRIRWNKKKKDKIIKLEKDILIKYFGHRKTKRVRATTTGMPNE